MICNKRKFQEIEAQFYLARRPYGKNKTRHEIRYYYCRLCRAFHLTSKQSKREIVLKSTVNSN